MKEVVIAGGTGLIGDKITAMLLDKGYKVNILSRSVRKSNTTDLQYYKWDISQNKIPSEVLKRATYIINLSGANVGGKRWNTSYKKTIIDSRVNSTRMLVNFLNNNENQVQAFLNASAVGYYGMHHAGLAKEQDGPGLDFMARVCVAWEAEANKLDQTKTRLVIPRTGIVLSAAGGALQAMANPVKLFAGAALGNGKQIVSWIHVEDICRAMLFALENENMSGPFNAVAPNPATNIEITRQLAKEFKKPLILPPVPGIFLNILLGEFAGSVLGSLAVSAEKLEKSGFVFMHPSLEETIKDLYKNKGKV
jgi:uncharacterized protein (TIGR01777 family)